MLDIIDFEVHNENWTKNATNVKIGGVRMFDFVMRERGQGNFVKMVKLMTKSTIKLFIFKTCLNKMILFSQDFFKETFI
jgi:hypothetical protein